jgi:O-antigen ligase
MAHRVRPIGFRPSLSLIMLMLLLALLALGGGSSREDALGQAVVRAGTATLLVCWVLAGGQISAAIRPVAILVAATAGLVVVQLIPLPPAIWTALPGRTVFETAATLSGVPQPWRPIAIVPDAAWNALFSLLAPFAALLFAGGCRREEAHLLPVVLLVLIVGSALVELAQFSGAVGLNPLMNARPEGPSGVFANRNHQALLLAMGCMIAPAWVFLPEHPARWRAWIALGLVALLVLMILATGSRAGLLLGALAAPIGVAMAMGGIRRTLKRAPRWAWPAMLAASTVVVLGLAALSLGADRAESLQRLVSLDPGQDMRTRALPILLQITSTYFPVGSGFGSFDAVFRLHEPFHLLEPTYFNHAHNDLLELVLTGGVPALLLLIVGLAWWLAESLKAWRSPSAMLARLGSSIVFLILVASAFDYPARTPLVMAILVLAAVLLTGAAGTPAGRPALRGMDRSL